jgi:hypothetical protein
VLAFDLEKKLYTAVVIIPNAENAARIALNYSFSNQEGENAPAIGNFGTTSVGGDVTISGFRINHPSDVLRLPPSRPPASFRKK